MMKKDEKTAIATGGVEPDLTGEIISAHSKASAAPVPANIRIR
jgi:hypothetical protein